MKRLDLRYDIAVNGLEALQTYISKQGRHSCILMGTFSTRPSPQPTAHPQSSN